MSVWLLYVAACLNIPQSVVSKQSWRAEEAPSGHTRTCFGTSLMTFTLGLYAGISITVVWSESPHLTLEQILFQTSVHWTVNRPLLDKLHNHIIWISSPSIFTNFKNQFLCQRIPKNPYTNINLSAIARYQLIISANWHNDWALI